MWNKCKTHLDTVHESYLKHLGFALCFGARMIGAGVAAILHGLCPAIFQYTGSQTVFRLNDELRARQDKAAKSHE
jgi:hypothetical protein